MNETKDILIPDLINYVVGLQPGTKEYDQALKQLYTLTQIDKELREQKEPPLIVRVLSNSAVVTAGANLVIAVLMLNFERADIITSAVKNRIGSR